MCPRDSQESSLAPQFESINSSMLSLLYGPTLISIHDYWKNHSFDYTDFCRQSDVSARFVIGLSRFVIAFLPMSKCLLISCLQSPSAVSNLQNWNSPGKNTGVSSHSLLQGIFPTQGWNPGLLHCMQILYRLSHQGSPQGLLDYRHRELITFPPMTLKREYSRAIYTTMVWNYVRERCGRYKAGVHLGNIHVKGEQSHIFFLYWIIAFRLKICCCFLYKKKSFTPSPSSNTFLC